MIDRFYKGIIIGVIFGILLGGGIAWAAARFIWVSDLTGIPYGTSYYNNPVYITSP